MVGNSIISSKDLFLGLTKTAIIIIVMVTMRNGVSYVLVHLDQFIKMFGRTRKSFVEIRMLSKMLFVTVQFQPSLGLIVFGAIE